MTILSFSSSDDQLSIFAIADIMEEKGDLNRLVQGFIEAVMLHNLTHAGWKIERQLDSLHCTLLPSHTLESADQFISQLQEACSRVKVQIVLHVYKKLYTYLTLPILPYITLHYQHYPILLILPSLPRDYPTLII